MNVFVFPTRNEPGLEIVQALAKSNKIRLFGGSSYDSQYDPARHLLQNYVLCPGYQDAGFKETFLGHMREHAIDLVFPAWDPLVALFSEWRVPGLTFVTPRAEIAHLVLSKRDTYAVLKDIIRTPAVYDGSDISLPVFAKPDRDSGSRNIMKVDTPTEFALARERGLLLCEYLPGPEYTVDCVSDLEGRLLFAQARHRAVINRGIALGTEAVDHPGILESVSRIAERLRIEGPWFAQFKENAGGEPVLMEINGRIAGSMTLTRMAGVNIPLIAAFLYSGEKVRIPQPRQGAVITRHLQTHVDTAPFDLVIWDWDDTLIRKDGKPDPRAMACVFDLHNRGIAQTLITRNGRCDELMRQHAVPNFFELCVVTEDKPAAIEAMLAQFEIEPARALMVNDSYAELFAIQERFPELRIVTPDALEVLGSETIP